MRLKELMEGLLILRNYYEDPDAYHTGAEHDIFYAYATNTPLSDADVKRMKELGWAQLDIPEDAPYDPNETWMATM